MSVILSVRRTEPQAAPPEYDFTPNLPAWASGNLITDTTFEAPDGVLLAGEAENADGLSVAPRENNTVASVNSTEAGPWSTRSARTFYAGGDPGNGDGGVTFFGPAGQAWRRIYFAIAVKLDTNYRMHESGGEKFWYPRITTGGSMTSSCMLNWHVQGSQTGTSPSWCFYLDPQIGDGRQYQPENDVYPFKGEWVLIEVEMHMNTPAQSNGVLRLWIDGAASIDRTDVRYSAAGSQSVFDGIYFDGTRGGPIDSGNVPAGGQSRYYNRLAFYASTSGS